MPKKVAEKKDSKRQKKYRYYVETSHRLTVDVTTDDWRSKKKIIEQAFLDAMKHVFAGTTVFEGCASVTKVKEIVKVVETREVEQNVEDDPEK